MKFQIENMECGGCVRSVTKAVQSVDADAQVTADVAGKTIEIRSVREGGCFTGVLAAAGFPVAGPV